MEIRFSVYNAPFSEPPQEGVHYISLDDQRDMRTGHFDAHVRLFLSLVKIPSVAFVGRPFAKPCVNFVANDDVDFLKQLYPTPFVKPASFTPSFNTKADINHLDELAYKYKIKSAKNRLSKIISFKKKKEPLNEYALYSSHSLKYEKKVSKAQKFLSSLCNKNNF